MWESFRDDYRKSVWMSRPSNKALRRIALIVTPTSHLAGGYIHTRSGTEVNMALSQMVEIESAT